MVRNDVAALLITILLPLLWSGCDYARMTSDEGHDTYEVKMPVMPPGSIATTESITALKMMGPAGLTNPLPSTPAVLLQGRVAYGNFCYHCHGQQGDGHATVGQSFAPLPTDLRSDRVQRQSDADLFFKIGFGFRRHPDLSQTMLEKDIWAVVHHVRGIKGR